MKAYDSKVKLIEAIVVGKTYYKNTIPLGWPPILFHKIEIIADNGSTFDVKINGQAVPQTIKKIEALLYIDCRDGYSNTI